MKDYNLKIIIKKITIIMSKVVKVEIPSDEKALEIIEMMHDLEWVLPEHENTLENRRAFVALLTLGYNKAINSGKVTISIPKDWFLDIE